MTEVTPSNGLRAWVLLALVIAVGLYVAAPRPAVQVTPSGATPNHAVGGLPGAETEPVLRTEAPSVSLPGDSAAPQPTGGIGDPASYCKVGYCETPAPAQPGSNGGSSRGIAGLATWFDAPYGTAAAGPALRDYLGTDWRGKRVSVTAPGCGCPAVVVILDDACWCPADGRLIDLNRQAFANLAMPSVGVIRVVIRVVE